MYSLALDAEMKGSNWQTRGLNRLDAFVLAAGQR
jgi:hypothetical protein